MGRKGGGCHGCWLSLAPVEQMFWEELELTPELV
jgi:hypothetical protein